MDDIFKDLQKASKNEIDTLTKWLKDSKLVEATKEGEEQARKLFEEVTDKNKVELDKFKDIVKKLADEQKKTFEELSKKLADEGPKFMDALAAGVNAFKETLASAKLVESSKAGEEKARALFADVSNKRSVELDKFKEIVSKLAQDQHKSFDELSKQLAAEGPKMLQSALNSGVGALKDALNLGK